MSTHVLSPDTQAILLLCANFGKNRQTEPEPLTLREYNDLATWLQENQMRPADLIATDGKDRLQEMMGVKLNPERLIALLERGGMLAFAVENWTNKGLWVLARSDTHYPKRLKKNLQHSAPAILYGVGNIELLSRGGLAVVGSRDVDAEGIEYTQLVAQTCAEEGIQVVSGGARGVDIAAMLAAVDIGGTAVGVLADSLTKAAVSGKYRSGIREGRLTLVSAYDPDAGFSVGNAMGRNKYIYGLADYALAISSSVGQGGTWAGATEALERIKGVPLFVRMQGMVPEGNLELVNKGAKSFPESPWNGSLRFLLEEAASGGEARGVSPNDATDTQAVESRGDTVAIASPDPTPRESPETQAASRLVTPAPKAPPAQEPNPVTVSPPCPKDIYEAVLPFILEKLEQPKDAKLLAECLDVRQSQLQDWLKRAVAEDKVKKTKKGYVVNGEATQLSLLLLPPD